MVKSQSGELMLVEVQNDSEVDYFQRMLYDVSKLVTQYIKESEPYGTIKKIYSINIVYFGLAQGIRAFYEMLKLVNFFKIKRIIRFYCIL